MTPTLRHAFVGAVIAAFFACTFALVAQETPAPPAAPAVPAPVAEPAADAPLRRLETEPDAAPEKSSREKARERARQRAEDRRANRTNNEVIHLFGDSSLPKGEKADAVVSIFGSSTVDGDVVDAVVSILGNTRVTGEVGDAAVAILGDLYVNSHVKGDAIAILGDLELGPDARVDGEVVCAFGTVKRDAQAVVAKGVQNVAVGGSLEHREALKSWIHRCLFYGRPLAFGPHLGWAWAIAASFLLLYVVLALLFRGGLEKCMDTLTTRPGGSVLTAFLTVMISPIAFILLVMTGVGIFLVPFLGAALLFTSLFGTAVVLAWFGLKIVRLIAGPSAHPALGVLFAGLVVLWIYTIPVLGFVTLKLLGWLGAGAIIFTLLQMLKRERPVTAAAPAAPTFTAPVSPAATTMGSTDATFFSPPVMPPPLVISAATLPRAGFWIRMAAMLLDAVLLAIIAGILTGGGKLALFGLATYAAVLWKLKGTTIGGVICGLKVVRLDDRPIDWGTAIVRALGCFLSLALAGLGFIWVAIDRESQSWHDKVAGTTVVRVPKGISLL
jgi:uncharacterized RDD family membrane protein YckC/cytoskeletal protein CcmA (bactofilin family)